MPLSQGYAQGEVQLQEVPTSRGGWTSRGHCGRALAFSPAVPYFTTTLEGLKALLIAESPIAFRRRLIFTEAKPLHRARMPADLPLG